MRKQRLIALRRARKKLDRRHPRQRNRRSRSRSRRLAPRNAVCSRRARGLTLLSSNALTSPSPKSANSAPKAPSAPASCRRTSTTTGSTWLATRTPRPTASSRSPATWKTFAPTGEVEVADEAAAKVTHCPKCGQRLPIVGRSLPALHSAQSDPRPARPNAVALPQDGRSSCAA